MKYLLEYINEELSHYQRNAKGLHQYGKTSAGQDDFERVIILKLAREALEDRIKQQELEKSLLFLDRNSSGAIALKRLNSLEVIMDICKKCGKERIPGWLVDGACLNCEEE